MKHLKQVYKQCIIISSFCIAISCNTKTTMGPNETKFKNIPNTIAKYKSTEAIEYSLSEARGELSVAVEIYINDMPFKKYYKGDNDAFYIDINDYILKKGKQIVNIKYISENGGMLRKDFEQDIRIWKVNSGLSFEDGKKIKVYSSPRIYVDSTDIIGDFVGAGSLVYEDSFTFEATVPYEFKGWADSEDLTKIKPEQLEKEALAAYQNIIDICKRRDREALYALFYQSEFERTQSKYYDEAFFEKFTAGYDFMLADASVKFHPLENYDVKLYGNGKVVALESKTHIGQSALFFDLVDTDQRTGKVIKGTSSMQVLLHKPKGSKVLVPIR